jgi:replication factor A1
MKLSELKAKQSGVNVEFDVVEKGPVREFNKFGRAGKVCNAVIKDDSGSVKLSLWNDDCDRVNVGNHIKMIDGYVGEYQGELQLTTGRAGKLEISGEAVAKGPAKKETKTSAKPAAKSAKKESEDEDEEEFEKEFTDDEEVDEEFVD